MRQFASQNRACAVIIVTHNSERYLPKAMASLASQSRLADQILIVDSGSCDLGYLEEWRSVAEIIVGGQEIGFCRGNNIGMRHLQKGIGHVLFLNPDAMLTPTFLEEAIELMEAHPRWGALTGQLLGYAIEKDLPTGLWDSTGLFCSWYGRWTDRDQGRRYDPERYDKEEEVEAICGALFFCRKEALDAVELPGGEIMDSRFFMYKEDIDLSLRLRRKGWQLQFVPKLLAYHCRGWSRDRRQMARELRLCSARNELRLQWYHPIRGCYSLAKFLGVKLFNL